MNLDLPLDLLAGVMLATIRVSAWLAVCPPFNTRLIPGPVKALTAVAIALPVAPQLRGQLTDLTGPGLAVSTVEQVFLGATLGFVTSMLFAAIQAAGDLIDVFGGLSMAAMFDPLSSVQSSLFGRFYNLLAVTLVFATDAHQMIIRGFMRSFQVMPMDGSLSLATLDKVLTKGLSELFISALQIAGPLIAVLFLSDVALGLLNRVAPALNAFQLGFPIKIFVTLSVAGTAIAVLPGAVGGLVDRAVTAVVGLAGG